MYVDVNVGVLRAPVSDVLMYVDANVRNNAVTNWPVQAGSIELANLSQVQSTSGGSLWIQTQSTTLSWGAVVWMPDPNNPKKGYWGILMADNSA
jgi:hypothetical protein